MKVYAETERLILREILPFDIEGMFELYSDPVVHKYLGTKTLQSMEEIKDEINFIRDQYNERGIGRWAAIEKSSGEFIGWSGLKLNKEDDALNDQTNFIDVGYRFIPRYWGKGYATESALVALEYGFKTMNYDVIAGIALIDNVASNKVLQKIGLKHITDFIFEDTQACWYELKRNNYEKTMS